MLDKVKHTSNGLAYLQMFCAKYAGPKPIGTSRPSPSRRSCRRDPLAHRLITGAIDVHCGVDFGHPPEGDEVVLPLLVLGKLDAVRALHVIDDGKLPAVRADDGRVRFDFIGLDHLHYGARFMPPSSPVSLPKTPVARALVSSERSLLPQVRHMRCTRCSTARCRIVSSRIYDFDQYQWLADAAEKIEPRVHLLARSGAMRDFGAVRSSRE